MIMIMIHNSCIDIICSYGCLTPFEHGFRLKSVAVVGQCDLTSLCSVETNWPMLKKIAVFGAFLCFFYNILKRFYVNKCEAARIAINHILFQFSNIRWMTRKGFENAAYGLVVKHLPRDLSNV